MSVNSRSRYWTSQPTCSQSRYFKGLKQPITTNFKCIAIELWSVSSKKWAALTPTTSIQSGASTAFWAKKSKYRTLRNNPRVQKVMQQVPLRAWMTLKKSRQLRKMRGRVLWRRHTRRLEDQTLQLLRLVLRILRTRLFSWVKPSWFHRFKKKKGNQGDSIRNLSQVLSSTSLFFQWILTIRVHGSQTNVC